ncbi:MAG: plastocyanin/azurin family copper-binding protein [Thermodesulfobacteriota bacterium]
MKKTFFCFALVSIFFVSIYMPLVEAQDNPSQSVEAEAIEGEVKEEDKTEVKESGNEEIKSPQDTEEQVGVKEETETKVEEGSETIHVIIIPDREVAGSSRFQPEEITVRVNEKIVWENKDTRTHFVGTMEIGGYPTGTDGSDEDDEDEEEDDEESSAHYFTSGYFAKGEKFEHSFDTPGTYIYYCFTHPIEMKGKIIVVGGE